MSINSETVIPTTFKGISDKHDRLHPQQLAQRGAVLPYHPFGCNQKGNQEEWLKHITAISMESLPLSRNPSGVPVGVGVDMFQARFGVAEGVAHKIRRLRILGSERPNIFFRTEGPGQRGLS